MLTSLQLLAVLFGGLPLTPAEEGLVRETVLRYEFGYASGWPAGAALPVREFFTTPGLMALAARKYPAVMGLLERIAADSPPGDAVKACSLGMGLAYGGDLGLLPIEHFKAAEYDRPDPGWGYPPRRHWRRNLTRSKYTLNPYSLAYLLRVAVGAALPTMGRL